MIFDQKTQTHYLKTRERSFASISKAVPRHLKSREYEQTAQSCRQTGQRFVDQNFPRNKHSIVGTAPPSWTPREWHSYVWKTPEEVYGANNYSIFSEISPEGLTPGSGGICSEGLFAALSALAERKNHILRLFDQAQITQEGIYSIWLSTGGRWKRVIVDESFPAPNHPIASNTPPFAFLNTRKHEIWPMLIEKALAKEYGGYANLRQGTTKDYLYDLTGSPCYTLLELSKGKKNQKWNRIIDALNKDYVIVASPGQLHGKRLLRRSNRGFSRGHIPGGYSILDAREVVDSRRRKSRILQLRNPLGVKTGTPDWSDGSHLWTNELRQKFGVFRDSRDGVFWMSWEAFATEFDQVDVCKVVQDNVFNSIAVRDPNFTEKTIIRFDISTEGKYVISANQIDLRRLQRNLERPMSSRTLRGSQNQPKIPSEYPKVRMVVGKMSSKTYEFKYVFSRLSNERNFWMDAVLVPGRYVALIRTYWPETPYPTNLFNFSVYGPEDVSVMQVPENEKLFDKAQYNIWKNFSKRFPSSFEYQLTWVKELSGLKMHKGMMTFPQAGLTILKFTHDSDEETLIRKFQPYGLVRTSVLTEEHGEEYYSMKINPDDHEVIVYLTDPRVGAGRGQPAAKIKEVDSFVNEGLITHDSYPMKALRAIRLEVQGSEAGGGFGGDDVVSVGSGFNFGVSGRGRAALRSPNWVGGTAVGQNVVNDGVIETESIQSWNMSQKLRKQNPRPPPPSQSLLQVDPGLAEAQNGGNLGNLGKMKKSQKRQKSPPLLHSHRFYDKKGSGGMDSSRRKTHNPLNILQNSKIPKIGDSSNQLMQSYFSKHSAKNMARDITPNLDRSLDTTKQSSYAQFEPNHQNHSRGFKNPKLELNRSQNIDNILRGSGMTQLTLTQGMGSTQGNPLEKSPVTLHKPKNENFMSGTMLSNPPNPSNDPKSHKFGQNPLRDSLNTQAQRSLRGIPKDESSLRRTMPYPSLANRKSPPPPAPQKQPLNLLSSQDQNLAQKDFSAHFGQKKKPKRSKRRNRKPNLNFYETSNPNTSKNRLIHSGYKKTSKNTFYGNLGQDQTLGNPSASLGRKPPPPANPGSNSKTTSHRGSLNPLMLASSHLRNTLNSMTRAPVSIQSQSTVNGLNNTLSLARNSKGRKINNFNNSNNMSLLSPVQSPGAFAQLSNVNSQKRIPLGGVSTLQTPVSGQFVAPGHMGSGAQNRRQRHLKSDANAQGLLRGSGYTSKSPQTLQLTGGGQYGRKAFGDVSGASRRPGHVGGRSPGLHLNGKAASSRELAVGKVSGGFSAYGQNGRDRSFEPFFRGAEMNRGAGGVGDGTKKDNCRMI